MIQLTANLSPGLVELIRSKSVHVDGIEVGPWFRVEQICEYRRLFPEWKFYFHHSNLIPRLKWIPGTRKLLRAYIACTQSPWISLHYSTLPPGYAWLGTKLGLYLPPPDFERSIQWFVSEVNHLKDFGLPVLLENMPSFPTGRYAFETHTENITRILDLTETGFLLDLAHARVVASVFGLDVHDYINKLPLEKVRQIHISGPRLKDGYLYDAHEDLQDEDYALLACVLAKKKPEVVTLEYFRDQAKLCEQLLRLDTIVR